MPQWKEQVVPRGITVGKVFVVLAGVAVAKDAGAQIDTNPPLQNVMLLVDSSGSMEYANDGTPVTCDEVDPSLPASIAPKGPSQKTRWMQLVEVLTGDVKDPECYSEDRGSTAFKNEFTLGTAVPYDFNYHVPYHRFLSGSGASACTIGAGVVDPNPFAWGATPFSYHRFNDATKSCTNFQQSETGLLDSYRDRMRFGLMTFDTSIDAGTGLSGNTADYLNGNTGTWSYFLNWRTNPDCNSNAACAKGKPAGCATVPDPPMEVGARNAAAPPWEGRMVPFGSPAATITDVRNTNANIQQVLTAVRPFGATPINGLLNDARDFFKNDADKDYVTGAASCDNQTGIGCFGPKYDGLVKNGCRTNNIILLTDGEPNLDLRPYCEGTSGGIKGDCPYANTTDEIVQELATDPDPRKAIKTFVIGFAVSSVDTGQPQLVDCSKISSFNQDLGTGQFDPGDLCGATMDPKLSACCTLAKIAFYGGTGNAYFASNATELREAISDIFDRIGGAISTRTAPVFASNSNASNGGAFSFYSSFHSGRDQEGGVTLKASVWSGVLERQRTECESQTQNGITTVTPIRRDIDADKGDRFSDNVNAADTSHPRAFYTVVAADDGTGVRDSLGTIRPSIPSTNPDGLGILSGVAQHGGTSDFLPPTIPSAAMSITKTACTGDGAPYDSDDDACAAKYLKWEIGVDPMPSSDPPGAFQRPNVFGAIYHSTPVLVGPPNEFLRDESYTQFTVEQALRPPMLYTETTDGQLHAFKVDKAPGDTNDTPVDKKVNNEVWSFFPPAVLPKLPAQFPRTQQMILDGASVVKDVVFVRSDADAKNGGAGVHWHTVLVSSFGAGGTGYFAVDITNPIPKSTDPTTTGPQMLWQLTTDASHNPLFGDEGGTPAIATLFFSPDGTDPKEYAVAILPGGHSVAPTGMLDKPPDGMVDTANPARDHIRGLKSGTGNPARSLTIVRLDTGEVVRSFRQEIDGPPSILPRSHDDLNAYTQLIAEISGQPVVFPADTGAVADRGFVGDREGLLWRLNLANTDPQKWTMDLFFDSYTGQAWDAGQPVATPPILSVDALGNLTVAFSTGDQESFIETPGVTNYLWSVSEGTTTTAPFIKSRSNWDLTFPRTDIANERAGARVSGTMQLFSSNLYFTTYNPPPLAPTSSDLCSDGNAGLCAMNYLRPAAAAHKGGFVASPPLDTTQPDTPCLPQGSSVIFGPGITQDPTCFSTDTYNDPYLGTSQHTSLANVNAGKFNLVVQTGMHGTNETKGQINTTTVALQTPLSATRIDSWAAVVE
jgi:type IV pilus assembly protein PilY1